MRIHNVGHCHIDCRYAFATLEQARLQLHPMLLDCTRSLLTHTACVRKGRIAVTLK